LEELKKEKIKKFDKGENIRSAYEFYERVLLDEILEKEFINLNKNKNQILDDLKSKWESLPTRDKKEFKKLEVIDEKRIKNQNELKKQFEKIKIKCLRKFIGREEESDN